MHLTLISAHPEPDSFNTSLARAYERGARESGASVNVVDLTALAFEPCLRGAHRTPMPDEPALAELRESVMASAHLAWFFPVWWYGLPALLKGLVDRLFLPGWAFAYEGGPLPRGLLTGRSSRYVATMDAPWSWYQLVHRDPIGSSFGRGTLRFVGLSPVERTLVYGVRGMSETQRQQWRERLLAQGRRDGAARRA